MNDNSETKTYITFGANHAVPDLADPNGYLTVVGVDRGAARSLVYGLFGDQWAFDYGEPIEHRWAPRGETSRIVVLGTSQLHQLEHDEGIASNALAFLDRVKTLLEDTSYTDSDVVVAIMSDIKENAL